jgi:hypothetical protein
MTYLQEILDREDKTKLADRAQREHWIKENRPDVKWAFRGPTVFRLFDGAQDCYISGNYLASIQASVSFLEQSLAAELRSIDRDDLKRANLPSLPDLAKKARAFAWISEDEKMELDRIWELRKPITHFRPPGHPARIEARQYNESTPIEEILERDARRVLTMVFHLAVNATGFGRWSGQIPRNYVRNAPA